MGGAPPSAAMRSSARFFPASSGRRNAPAHFRLPPRPPPASPRHCDTLLYVIASVAKQSSAFFAEWIAAVPSEPRNDGETPLCVIARAFPRHPGLRPGIWLASLNCFALLLRRPQRWKCVLATCTLARIPWHLLLYFNNKFVFEKGFGNEKNFSYPGGALRGPGNHLLRGRRRQRRGPAARGKLRRRFRR